MQVTCCGTWHDSPLLATSDLLVFMPSCSCFPHWIELTSVPTGIVEMMEGDFWGYIMKDLEPSIFLSPASCAPGVASSQVLRSPTERLKWWGTEASAISTNMSEASWMWKIHPQSSLRMNASLLGISIITSWETLRQNHLAKLPESWPREKVDNKLSLF